MKSNIWKLLALLIIVTLLVPSLVGCQSDDEEEPTSKPAAPAEETEAPSPEEPSGEPKSVTITFFEEPDNLNPLYTSMWFSGIARDFFLVGLWTFDDNQEMNLELAAEVPTKENGGISEDGTVLTIKLRQDAQWSDGEPITAEDFVFTYEMTMAEGNLVQTRYPYDEFVKSVTAPDDYTIQIELTAPYVAWATSFFTFVLPEHVLRPVYDSDGSIDGAAWNRQPTVGNGPFVFSEWQTASFIKLEANPNYWRGRPNIDEIFIKITPDDEAQMAAIKTGETDIGVFLSAADKPDIDKLEDVSMISVPSGYIESWFFNMDPETAHPAMLDVKVRQALVYGIDRQQIIDELFYGLYEIPVTFWAGTPYENPALEPYPYDPEMAKSLLDEAGWVDEDGNGIREKDGQELMLRYSTTAGNELREATQVVVQNMFKDMGIGIEILNYSYDTLWNSYGEGGPIATGQYDFAEWSTTPGDYPDPNDTNWLCSEIPSDEKPEGGNWQKVCIEELDQLFQQQAVTIDMQERIQLFYQIEQIMHDQVVWMGVRTDPDLWTLSSKLQNVRISGVDPFWNAYEWDVE